MLRGDGYQLSKSGDVPRVVVAAVDWPSPNAAMDSLFDLFPDKYPALINEASGKWTFELHWPRHLLETVDPLLLGQARNLFDTPLSDLDRYIEVRRHGNADFVFSMFHSRALLAPALAMQRNGSVPRVVIHVDAHHDLAACLMVPTQPETLANRLFDRKCHLRDPESVNAAIDAGLINKASFLTAFVGATWGTALAHVDHAVAKEQFWLEPVIDSMSFGMVSCERLSIHFRKAVATNARWKVLESPDLPIDLSVQRDDQVWLDVDLDAFCNRFDGDSDARSRRGSAEELGELNQRIGAFLADLTRCHWAANITAVSVAASPGFFPSEYWELAIPAINHGIENVLVTL
jgi:hypothetical protein